MRLDIGEDEIRNSDRAEKQSEEVDKDDKEPEGDLKAPAILKEILSNSLFLLAVLIITLLLVRYVGQRTVVIGDSMEHTLSNGDNLIVDKISYRFREPERFEIIVFPFIYKDGTYYIKRIIGLPGETVRIDQEGNIYINGEILKESYGAEVIADPGNAVNELLLGPDEYFVLGDNRNHSSDSRTTAVGFIHKDKIIGRAFFRIFPFSKFGSIEP